MKVIKQTARCRVVVTGAYHAAVFALAQGIPVVCLSNSPYYLAKFQGLEDLFGSGCTIVTLERARLSRKAGNGRSKKCGTSADAVRSPSAPLRLRQIEASLEAYHFVIIY